MVDIPDPSDSDRLLGEGVPMPMIRLDGTRFKVNFKYSMRGTKYLEDHFGSIEQAAIAFGDLQGRDPRLLECPECHTEWADDEEAGNLQVKRADVLTHLMVAGLQDYNADLEPRARNERGRYLEPAVTADDLLDYTNFTDIAHYLIRIDIAFARMLPRADKKEKGTNPNGETPSPSPGATSTTSQPSDSEELITNSGTK